MIIITVLLTSVAVNCGVRVSSCCSQYRKKMDVAKAHIQTLKKKQKEVEKMGEIANVASNNNKRLNIYTPFSSNG